MSNSLPAWHVVGAGSLGTLWACRLARGGAPVRLILRNAARLQAYQAAGGLTLIEHGRISQYSVPAELASAQGPIERLLLTCKAYDAAPAMAALRHRLSADTQIVLLQNGLGSQNQVATRAGAAS
jgi:2-dehydropantoate 2-reductase